MKRPVISCVYCNPVKDRLVQTILRRCGAYYLAGDFFYQRLWYQRLSQIGLRMISVEKLPYHGLWDIRCYGTLAAQTYLLLTLAVSKPHFGAKDMVLNQLHSEIQRIAKDLGAPIRRDCVRVARKGAYVRITFIWPLGKPGRWIKPEKKAEAFSFLIRPWLHRNRN